MRWIRSADRVSSDKSKKGFDDGSVEAEVVVRPWPRASGDSMPALGASFLISELRTAKERPDDPAPWCVMNKGPFPFGEVR